MPTLVALAAAKRIRPRDLDIMYVAYGEISRDTIAQYLAGGGEDRRPAPDVARELTERICACQHHDGGRTSLVEADEAVMTFRVEGACVTCPQIRYTMGLLESSVGLRADAAVEVRFVGLAAHRSAPPPEHQLTLALLMRRTGMTFADLDDEIDRLGRLIDEDLERLAHRCLIRQSLRPAGTETIAGVGADTEAADARPGHAEG
jgi:Fe-S cluster biogenesis protein NfuA